MIDIFDFRFSIFDWGLQRTQGLSFLNSRKNHPSEIRNRKFSRGLSLIEVMLAVVILGIGAGTLMVATARCMSVVVKAHHYSEAHRLILSVNTKQPLSRGEINEGVESGTFEEGYRWEREILESENEDREGLYTIRTRVSWSDRSKTAFEEVITYFYLPPEEER